MTTSRSCAARAAGCVCELPARYQRRLGAAQGPTLQSRRGGVAGRRRGGALPECARGRRDSPRQSALLEAMEEQQITVDGETHALPKPFFVIATQNPKHHIGTFPLPESQLDRFLMRITLGYPDAASERALLKNQAGRGTLIAPACDINTLISLQQLVKNVHVSEQLLDYLQDLILYTRTQFSTGLSPRAGLGLRQCAQAWALLEGRDFVIPEDVQAVFASVVSHRLAAENNETAKQILERVAIR